jgi:hypothetical protein
MLSLPQTTGPAIPERLEALPQEVSRHARLRSTMKAPTRGDEPGLCVRRICGAPGPRPLAWKGGREAISTPSPLTRRRGQFPSGHRKCWCACVDKTVGTLQSEQLKLLWVAFDFL